MPEIKIPQETGAEHDKVQRGHNNGRQPEWTRAGNSLGSIMAGSALAVYGVSRKSAGGAALAAAGGLLALRGVRHATHPKLIHVEHSFTINRPVNEVFSFFRNFENLPQFMHHLKSVENTGDRSSHWTVHAPLGLQLEWDVEITDDAENRYLIWQSLPGAVLPNRGAAEFQPASEYHGGTEVTVAVEYAPRAGRGGAIFARIFGHEGREPGMQIREDLRRLKQLLETGEIATTKGQPHGRRSAFVRMVRAVNEAGRKDRESVDWKQVESQHKPWAMSS